MNSLVQYICENKEQKIPSYSKEELQKMNKEYDKDHLRDKFSKEVVDEIPGSEFMGDRKYNQRMFKVGDIIWYSHSNSAYAMGGSDSEYDAYQIMEIRRRKGIDSLTRKEAYEYRITAVCADMKNIMNDTPKHWENSRKGYEYLVK